jgi:hypothetical protein
VYADKWVIGRKGILPNDVELNQDTFGIADRAFVDSNAINLTMPSSVAYVGMQAFGFSSTNIVAITWYYNSQIIADFSSYLKSNVKTIILPNGKTEIEASEFSGHQGLRNILIPHSVNLIGSGAFVQCSNLAAVYYEGAETDWNGIQIGSNNNFLANAKRYFYTAQKPLTEGYFWRYVNGKPSVWEWDSSMATQGLAYTLINGNMEYEVSAGTATSAEIIIPASYGGKPVTKIADQAFSFKYSITSVVIPASVAAIGNGAFYCCNSL